MSGRAFDDGYRGRPLQHQLPSGRVRDDLLQALQRDGPLYLDDGPGVIRRQHLAVVVIGQP